MAIIKKKTDIDYEKLKELFQKRGHDIIAPGFLDRCNDVFDGKDQETTIFQCNCGEVFSLGKDLAKRAVDKIGSEDVPCKRCGNIFEKISPGGNFVDFVKIDHFEKILNIVDEFDGKDFERTLTEINSIDPELINATNPSELFYQIHELGKQLSRHHDSESPNVALIRELISRARMHLDEFKKLLLNLSVGEDEKNTFLVTVENNQHKFLYKQSKFFNLAVGHINEKTLVKMDINSKLNEYNHFFEEKGILDILLNLVRICEGQKYLSAPFKAEKIQYKNKAKPVEYTLQKISIFEKDNNGKPVNLMLKTLLHNRLRNLHGHNDYRIDLENKKIISPKYEIEFEELEGLLTQSNELKLNLRAMLMDHYYRYYPVIRSIQLGYDDPVVNDGVLMPASPKTLSELHIVGYGFRQDNIVHPKIKLKKDRIEIESSIGFDYYDLDDWAKEWIKHIVENNGEFTISYVNVLDFRQPDPLTQVKLDLTSPPLHYRSNNFSQE